MSKDGDRRARADASPENQHFAARLVRRARAFWRERTANMAPLAALMVIPLLGIVGMATESSTWLLTQRGAQHAADAAALAAANNADASALDAKSLYPYQREGLAVSSNYGFTDGSSNTSVSLANGITCPDGSGKICYQATVSRKLALTLVQLVGYNGNDVIGSQKAVKVLASAVAKPVGITGPVCLLALDTTVPGKLKYGLDGSGDPNANMTGCNVYSNSTAYCSGHNLGATYGGAAGVNGGCGITTIQNTNAVVADPYAGKYTVPPNNCPSPNSSSSYPQESGNKSPYGLPSALPSPKGTGQVTNQIGAATIVQGAVNYVCGDAVLTANVNLSSGNTVIVVENGRLDLNGFTLQTSGTAGATIVFSGNSISSNHYLYDSSSGGGGTLNISSPTTGSWQGVALWQDASLTSGLDPGYFGNRPTLDISGIVYFPNANLNFSGAVNKSGNGYNCFILIGGTVSMNGTGNIYANPTSQCSSQGVPVPTATLAVRAILVG